MAELNWTELINDIVQSVKLYSTHLGPIMGHRFRSLRLLDLFSCAFITNFEEWSLHRRIMP